LGSSHVLSAELGDSPPRPEKNDGGMLDIDLERSGNVTQGPPVTVKHPHGFPLPVVQKGVPEGEQRHDLFVQNSPLILILLMNDAVEGILLDHTPLQRKRDVRLACPSAELLFDQIVDGAETPGKHGPDVHPFSRIRSVGHQEAIEPIHDLMGIDITSQDVASLPGKAKKDMKCGPVKRVERLVRKFQTIPVEKFPAERG
jgi:hypothetical protein